MKKAFTLIELLIVVAIIAILAAIAVPNFLEAQTRAKVSRTKADMRSETTALETYYIDNNAYPNCHAFGVALAPPGDKLILERLSTPIAYLSSALLIDPFKVLRRYSASRALGMKTIAPVVLGPTEPAKLYNSYIYQSWNETGRFTVPGGGAPKEKSNAYVLHSAGPDSSYYNLGGVLANDGADQIGNCLDLLYDATNGTVSRGSIWRGGGVASGNALYKAGEGLVGAIRSQR